MNMRIGTVRRNAAKKRRNAVRNSYGVKITDEKMKPIEFKI